MKRQRNTFGGKDKRLLTNIREHLYTVFNRTLLDWDQPVTVIDSEHCLQQLHKDRLPGLRGEGKKTRFYYYDGGTQQHTGRLQA